MWGKLIVTKDVDAYLQANPEPTPAATAAVAGHQHHNCRGTAIPIRRFAGGCHRGFA